MVRRGNPQNDKENYTGYVARELPVTQVYMAVATHEDAILVSDDMGQTYVSQPTLNGPSVTTITNSNPSNIAVNSSGQVAVIYNKRVSWYPTFGGPARRLFDTQTNFSGKEGTKKLLINGTTGFSGRSVLLSEDGKRIVFFADAKMTGYDDVQGTMLYTEDGTHWRYSFDWGGSTYYYEVSASDDLKVMVNPTYISTDYGETVTELNTEGYTILKAAVSGNGKVIYCIRERFRSGSRTYIDASYFSVSKDNGQTWTNLYSFIDNPVSYHYSYKADISVNHNGNCVAFVLDDFFGWTPNGGSTFFTEHLVMEQNFYYVSIDSSGYYVAITNTNKTTPSEYIITWGESKVYIKNMHDFTMSEPNINAGLTGTIAKVRLK